jgi:hypothetical protein
MGNSHSGRGKGDAAGNGEIFVAKAKNSANSPAVSDFTVQSLLFFLLRNASFCTRTPAIMHLKPEVGCRFILLSNRQSTATPCLLNR